MILLALTTGCSGDSEIRPSPSERSESMLSEMASDHAEQQRMESEHQQYQRMLERLDREAERASEQAYINPTEVNKLRAALTWSRYNLWLTYNFESNGYDCPPDRPVKGNFSFGEGAGKVYHKPMWLYYGQTIPEECYKTAKQARANGFRPSRVRH